jgi:hypothetical protein
MRVFHLNKLFDTNRVTYRIFLTLYRSTQRSYREINSVFLSPQFLVNNPGTLGGLLNTARERTR